MAQVFLAKLHGIGGFERHVVLKTVRPERVDDESYVAMFLDEARLVSRLNHQHIAQVHDVGVADDGTYFLAMEYLHGETLRAVLERARDRAYCLPLDFALTVVCAAAAGLHHAHERRGAEGQPLQIVHRDVSPSNVIVGYDGSIKLIDFGIAKADERSTRTQTGFVKGKAGYMAPEQALGYPVDRRSDIFALGIVLYELTTQVRAFKGASEYESVQKIVRGELMAPSVAAPGYPPELEHVVMTALERDPDDRFGDADAMRRAIELTADHLGVMLGDLAVTRVLTELFGRRAEPWIEADGDDDLTEVNTESSPILAMAAAPAATAQPVGKARAAAPAGGHGAMAVAHAEPAEEQPTHRFITVEPDALEPSVVEALPVAPAPPRLPPPRLASDRRRPATDRRRCRSGRRCRRAPPARRARRCRLPPVPARPHRPRRRRRPGRLRSPRRRARRWSPAALVPGRGHAVVDLEPGPRGAAAAAEPPVADHAVGDDRACRRPRHHAAAPRGAADGHRDGDRDHVDHRRHGAAAGAAADHAPRHPAGDRRARLVVVAATLADRDGDRRGRDRHDRRARRDVGRRRRAEHRRRHGQRRDHHRGEARDRLRRIERRRRRHCGDRPRRRRARRRGHQRHRRRPRHRRHRRQPRHQRHRRQPRHRRHRRRPRHQRHLRPAAPPAHPAAPPAHPAAPPVDGATPAAADPAAAADPTAMVRVRITTDPDDATVVLGGDRLGHTPIDLEVPRGTDEVLLKIRKHGYYTEKITVSLTRDLRQDVRLRRRR
ncbi:MAG: serine/threonine protein kinase [Kofleriaceae bacterium]|nr:serine/threonine protein kinase [Kofleriaceae bacterium]